VISYIYERSFKFNQITYGYGPVYTNFLRGKLLGNAISAARREEGKLGFGNSSIHNHPSGDTSPSQDDYISYAFGGSHYITDNEGHVDGSF
jgi:hypothetical protein